MGYVSDIYFLIYLYKGILYLKKMFILLHFNNIFVLFFGWLKFRMF
jgi:hypothetical protein